jgi:hypothetical protein
VPPIGRIVFPKNNLSDVPVYSKVNTIGLPLRLLILFEENNSISMAEDQLASQ